MSKMKYEEIGTCARIEVKIQMSESSYNIQTFVGSIFSIFFFPKFLFRFTFYKFSEFHPLKM